MNVLPVITRELRAEARHAFTYWLRVIGAGVVTLAAVLFALQAGMRPNSGGAMFVALHYKLHVAIWILVPLLTADCLSRERREGTLGLLFLTPLRALDIVVAKSLAHGLRAATLLLAVLPVIALPLLMGGMSWEQGLASLFVNATAICLALAAGVLGSAFCKTWVRALILAACFVFIFSIAYAGALGFAFSIAVHGASFANHGDDYYKIGLNLICNISPEFSYQYFMGGSVPSFRWRAIPMGGPAAGSGLGIRMVAAAGAAWIAAVITLFITALIAAAMTKHNWQQKPPSPFAEWLRAKFTTPRYGLTLFRRWMKRSLDRNPIGWLERRTWSGRIVIWGWFAVMISVYSLILTEPGFLTRGFRGIHVFMGWTLMASLAMNASMSFRRERETRVLELLLVSPLREPQIILGRLRGLWGQFLPSIGLLLGGWIYLSTALERFSENAGSMFSIAVAFATIPVIGLYYSLICRNFLTALLFTILVGIILPAIQVALVGMLAELLPDIGIGVPHVLELFRHPALFQLAVATWLSLSLHRRLVHRRFATETT